MNCKECIHNNSDVIYAEGYRQGGTDMEKAKQVVIDALLKHIETVRAETIEEFATELKETLNQEFPRNYPSVKPYFTLDNARILVDAVAEQMKEVRNEKL